jgi:hypothetical protein
MTLQGIAVAVIVPLCALYGVWTLIGAAARRRVVSWLATRPLPAAWRRRLERADASANASGCDGCDNNTDAARKKPPATQTIVRVHRRRR